MEVAAINEGDANPGTSERLRGVEAAEAAADDDERVAAASALVEGDRLVLEHDGDVVSNRV